MPAVPFIAAAASAIGTVSAVSNARQQKKDAARAAELSRRQAAVTNQANAQAQANASERDQIARQIEADRAAQAEQTDLTPDVALAQQDVNAAKRRRSVQAQFNVGGVADGSLRI